MLLDLVMPWGSFFLVLGLCGGQAFRGGGKLRGAGLPLVASEFGVSLRFLERAVRLPQRGFFGARSGL